MRNFSKVLMLAATVSIFTFTSVDYAYAGWSKSSSSSVSRSMSYSRSYTPSRTTSSWGRSQVNSSSKFVGFGSKPSAISSSSSEKSSPPPSLSNSFAQKKSVLATTSSGVDSTKAYNTVQQNRPSKATPFVASAPAESGFAKPSSTASSNEKTYVSSSPSYNTNKKYVTNYYYNSPSGYHYHYDVPTYYHPYHPMYGAWNGFFLGMLLSNALQPSYYNWAYSHYNDPGYIAWHQDMEQQAQNNAELRAQLSQLDNKVDSLRAQNTPKTNALPDGMSNDEATSAVNPVQETPPAPAPVQQSQKQQASPQEKSNSGGWTVPIILGSLSIVAIAAVFILL